MTEDRKPPTLEDFKWAIREIFGTLPVEAVFHIKHKAQKPTCEQRETIDGIGESCVDAAAFTLNAQYHAKHLSRIEVGGEGLLGAIILTGVSSAVADVTYRGSKLWRHDEDIAMYTAKIYADQFTLNYYSKMTGEDPYSKGKHKSIGCATRDAVKRLLGRRDISWDAPPMR